MTQARPKKEQSALNSGPVRRVLREGGLIVLATLAIFLLVALMSFDPRDPAWSHSGFGEVRNLAGPTGAWLADVLFYAFGLTAYLFPLVIAYAGWLYYTWQASPRHGLAVMLTLRISGFVLTLSMGAALAALHFSLGASLPVGPGGALGESVGRALVAAFSFYGATLFVLSLFLVGITLLTSLSWLRLVDNVGRLSIDGVGYARGLYHELRDRLQQRQARQQRREVVQREQQRPRRSAPRIEPVVESVKRSERSHKERQQKLFETGDEPSLPPLSLLDEPEDSKPAYSTEALEAMSRQVELKLRDFGVEVEVVAVHPGPVITRFELQPAAGVKVSQISNLSKDLARALSAISVRVVEVIPGKSVVGLEIPNERRELVSLGEMLKSEEFDRSSSPLTLVLGKDIAGRPTVADLGRMPHLLVAGTTGSGKSVALNAMLLSLLYKSSADQVRLILIDPKMLELSVYDGIPHLLAPVVTDMSEAGHALRWCVAEMERRYRLMSKLGVRNLAGYNRKVSDAEKKGAPISNPFYDPDSENADPTLEFLSPMPHLVVVVDELADLMMVVGKKVEELIARLAQKARAAGIHLILATQRPSVDVITGLIKANIPVRIAFQVSSRVDSRTILDQSGAEQLLGHGDMLYLPPGSGFPERVHGAFVDDHEVHEVVEYLRSAGEPDYDEDILSGASDSDLLPAGTSGNNANDAEADPLYDEAVAIVTETRKASISGVQRRLRIGYNRAARLVEEMERAGIVGPLQSNGAREVLAAAPPPSGD